MISQRVSARALAEFALAGGDLRFGSISAMREGAALHRSEQSRYPEGFQKEVSLSLTVVASDVNLTVYGRADGVCLTSSPPVIEEIKSAQGDLPGDGFPVHWAQANIYAHMLCQNNGFDEIEVRLKYVNRQGKSRVHRRVMTSLCLSGIFEGYAGAYCEWISRVWRASDRRRPSMRALEFPFESYRAGQREMAAATYQAIRDGHNALVQAPTGTGKTMAALFAAIKAMGEGLTGRVFYLTARNTAREAATRALDILRGRGLMIRSIVITAKEKACPMGRKECDPALCPLAVGYYDRLGDALKLSIDAEKLDRDEIAELSKEYSLCPFELSLDLALTRDVVICDYNYVFDPKVKLKRFFQDKCDCALLIDEAHNLIDRARDMFSCEIRASDFRAVARNLKRAGAAEHPLYAAARAVAKAMKSVKSACEYPRWTSELDEGLLDSVEAFADTARLYLESGMDIADCFFAANDFVRVAGELSPKHLVLLEPSPRDMSVKLWCFDPADRLRESYLKTKGAVLFSGTLSPMEYYAKAVGLDTDRGDALVDLPSPFPSENLMCVAVPINTTFKMREATIDAVVGVIKAMCLARKGNYLACFPSYKYLETAREKLVSAMPDADVVSQSRGMTRDERDAFLRLFKASGEKTMLALVVMGGIFTEGIDLPGERLSGAAIVGVGMPGLSLERAALAGADEDDEQSGMLAAYTYPGIERVLQCAGRVIRSETDTGVVLLIDERFTTPQYESLLPGYWSIALAKNGTEVIRALERFWKRAGK
ncbi:MAG: ATP-dependent DNA helicase [Clostridia bacterium]|nr:ATP-dependent DNA helicase [Clostridia bacterium]